MPFCPYCGTSVKEQHKFCPSCGKELEPISPRVSPPPTSSQFQTEPQAAPSQPLVTSTPHSAPQAEAVRVVIPNLAVSKSLGRKDVFNLIVTDRRSIFAKLTNEVMVETVKTRRLNAAAEGKGFFGQWKAQMAGTNTYSDRYYAIAPDQALNETKDNFAIDNAVIRGIKTKVDIDEDEQTWEIEISTASKKLKFTTDYDPKGLLNKAYGTR